MDFIYTDRILMQRDSNNDWIFYNKKEFFGLVKYIYLIFKRKC